MKLSVQENLIPGETLEQKWEFAQRAGYDAIESRGKGNFEFSDRIDELQKARAAGIDMPIVCPEMPHFVGNFDPQLRADAIANMKSMLSVMAEIGGEAAMTPASWGMFSLRLPPFVPPRSAEEDRKVLVEAFRELGEHAEAEGVKILLEPLNRYEDHMINSLSAAMSICDEVDLPSVRVVGDTFHMNIEEDDPIAAIHDAGSWISHMQVMDSNRNEPGTGHLDFAAYINALKEVGYDGYLALECRLREPAEIALPKAARVLRDAM